MEGSVQAFGGSIVEGNLSALRDLRGELLRKKRGPGPMPRPSQERIEAFLKEGVGGSKKDKRGPAFLPTYNGFSDEDDS